jgi:uncharacterized SAM-binding protein YcdF (DUF218 family)
MGGAAHARRNNQKERHANIILLVTARKKRLASCVVGILLILFGLWLGHQHLLQNTAGLWVEYDSVEPADAVAIFGGGVETRPSAAAEYFRQGLVPRILVSNVSSAVEHRSSLSHTEKNLAELRKLGVPDNVVEIFGCNLSSTYQEALALKHWSLSAGARRVIVPTEYFSARRVRWITQRVFQGTGVEVRVPVITSVAYLQGEWWNNADALLAFQREVIKYLGYRLLYGLLLPWYEAGNTSERCAN